MSDKHPDDEAIDRCAAAMKERMREGRNAGKGGWDNPNECSVWRLNHLFKRQYIKPEHNKRWIDIVIYAMMIWYRKVVVKK